MRPTVEILSQGDEVIEGSVVNTNAAWLSRALVAMGFEVIRHTCVGDDLVSIVGALREIANRSDLCISSGGLGPTVDDLTAEAASIAFDAPLRSDTEALHQIEKWFQQSGRTMAEINRRQALMPEGAHRLDNDWGTAPGFSIHHGQCQFYFVPGVPREMMAMFEHRVSPELTNTFPSICPTRLTFHTIGVGESSLQDRLKGLELPTGVRLGFRAKGAENEVKLTFSGQLAAGEEKPVIERVRSLLGDAIFHIGLNGEGPSNMAAFVGAALREKKQRVLVHESLSGGNLSLSLNLQGVLALGEIHPSSNTPLPFEDESVIEHELRGLADHLLRKHAIDGVIVERWHSDGGSIQAQRLKATLWTLAASEHQILLERRELHGSLEQLSKAATLWSLNTLRRVLGV